MAGLSGPDHDPARQPATGGDSQLWDGVEEEGAAWQQALHHDEQGYTFSFSQLTINADTHPLLRRMHKPRDEKRSLVIVSPEDYDAWLGCRDSELARTFLVQQATERLLGTPIPRQQ